MFAIGTNNEIILTRGDTARFDIVARKKDDGTIYTPGEDEVITFTVKKNVGGRELIVKTGQSVTISGSDTASLANGEYVYDVDITYASGERRLKMHDKIIAVIQALNQIEVKGKVNADYLVAAINTLETVIKKE